MEEKKYSVLLPVYHKDNPEWLKTAIDSMVCQTLPPEEIVIAVDGPIGGELEEVIQKYEKNNALFSVYRFENNEGRGLISRKAVPLCRNEYIARMDADDYSHPERCETQINYLLEHKEVRAVGCNINEFIGEVDNVVSSRKVPESHDEIVKFAKRRMPVNHVTLIYMKSDVLKAGNYSDLRSAEDYEFVVRMIRHGINFHNIDYPYVNMRINDELFKRRGGMRYLKTIYGIKKGFLKSGFYSRIDFLFGIIPNLIVCLSPNFVRNFVYRKFLREKGLKQ
jgi:glycosyltransferase involved in cell wall biosynthesis